MARTQPTPARQVADLLRRTPPGEMPPIPQFLLVGNRTPPTSEQQERWDRTLRSIGVDRGERVDWRKPRSVSWEEWDALQARAAEDQRAATLARVSALREKYGDAPRVPRSLRIRARGVPGAPPRRRDRVTTTQGGSKTALIAEMMLRPDGCTTAEVLAATGWPAVSMPAQARSAGLALCRDRVGGVLRYYGSR